MITEVTKNNNCSLSKTIGTEERAQPHQDVLPAIETNLLECAFSQSSVWKPCCSKFVWELMKDIVKRTQKKEKKRKTKPLNDRAQGPLYPSQGSSGPLLITDVEGILCRPLFSWQISVYSFYHPRGWNNALLCPSSPDARHASALISSQYFAFLLCVF